MPAPYLIRAWIDDARIPDRTTYPFCLPIFKNGFDLTFSKAVTILVGENGSGKSTILEGLAALAGYDDAGGGKGYMPVDHSAAIERSGVELAGALRAGWRPKITEGWFFKAETFFSVARYLDKAAAEDFGGPPPPDFLSHSHGEGFLRFFDERLSRQGIYFFDEPESALSPARQLAFLKVLRRMQEGGVAQVVMATHSPILMALPDACLLRLQKYGIEETRLEETEHYRLLREFCIDPHGFIDAMLADP